MILNIKRAVFCSLALFAGAVTAQTITNRNEFVVAGGSGDFAPFWHFSNTDGVNSYKPNSSYLRVAAEGEHPAFTVIPTMSCLWVFWRTTKVFVMRWQWICSKKVTKNIGNV